MSTRDEDKLSYMIVGAAIEVHRGLGGPGLLESVYEEALIFELESHKLYVERQKIAPIFYKGHQLATPLRVDVVVENLVVVECKSAIDYNPIFAAQTLTYLRLLNLKLGLVINFGQRVLKEGVHRVVNGL